MMDVMCLGSYICQFENPIDEGGVQFAFAFRGFNASSAKEFSPPILTRHSLAPSLPD